MDVIEGRALPSVGAVAALLLIAQVRFIARMINAGGDRRPEIYARA